MPNTTETHLYCPRCGFIHTIYRRTSRQRRLFHYKKFYCFNCKHMHNHIELKDKNFSEEELKEMVKTMRKQRKY